MKKIKIALILFLVISTISILILYGVNRILPKELKPIVNLKENSAAGITAVPTTDLDYDHTNMALVVDGEGKIYKPINWTGGSGKKQVTGDLIFDTLDGKAKHVGLNIKGVDGKNVSFDWEL